MENILAKEASFLNKTSHRGERSREVAVENLPGNAKRMKDEHLSRDQNRKVCLDHRIESSTIMVGTSVSTRDRDRQRGLVLNVNYCTSSWRGEVVLRNSR